MQKKLASVLLVCIIFILILAGAWYIIFKSGMVNIDISTNTGTITQDDMTLTYEYIQDNKWTYTITGQLPNPCYKTSVGTLVAESFPEQVTITLSIEKPDPNTVCTQVIQELNITGEFSASDQATISFKIDNQEEK
ncbi:MAG: hypothetical protein PHE21_03000 [Candidatus Dojkabacteria bacterium]|nr:hypothetical protein [Candidatus Dojkabacteria bacterium]